ncbi:unnamed protein product [Aphanomyces euteiches]
MDVFRSLQRGASFDTKRFEKEISLFKGKHNKSGAGLVNHNIGEVDFFGKASEVKKIPPTRPRTASVDVPSWAGAGDEKRTHKEGSKQRRKRKLSEDAIAEAVTFEEDRMAASQLLVPSKSLAKEKKKKKKAKAQTNSIDSPEEDSAVDAEEEYEEDMTLFRKTSSDVANAESTEVKQLHS